MQIFSNPFNIKQQSTINLYVFDSLMKYMSGNNVNNNMVIILHFHFLNFTKI